MATQEESAFLTDARAKGRPIVKGTRYIISGSYLWLTDALMKNHPNSISMSTLPTTKVSSTCMVQAPREFD